MKSFDWRLNEKAMNPTMWMGKEWQESAHCTHVSPLFMKAFQEFVGGSMMKGSIWRHKKMLLTTNVDESQFFYPTFKSSSNTWWAHELLIMKKILNYDQTHSFVPFFRDYTKYLNITMNIPISACYYSELRDAITSYSWVRLMLTQVQ